MFASCKTSQLEHFKSLYHTDTFGDVANKKAEGTCPSSSLKLRLISVRLGSLASSLGNVPVS